MSDVYSNNTKENQPRNMQEIASTDGQFESSILTHANDGNLIVPATYITQYYYNYGTGPQIGANNGSIATSSPDNEDENNQKSLVSASVHPSELPQNVKWADIMWEIDENTYEIQSPAHLSDYSVYIRNAELANNKTKPFLPDSSPIDFTSAYVGGSISFDMAKTRQAARVMAYLKYLKPEIQDAINTLTSLKAGLDDANQIKIGLLSRYTIITGPGGIGKSMLLKHLLLEATEKSETGGFIPVFTSLKEFKSDYPDLESCMYSENESLLTVPLDKFKTDLRKGGFLLLLDGLDEVSYQNMIVFDKLLEKFIKENPNNQIVMSSRPYTDFVSYKRFTVLKLLPLRKEQSIELIEKIPYNADHLEIKREFISRIKNSQFDKHKDFISNPLLLTIMFMTFEQYGRIADRIHVFYNDAYQTMYWKHDRGNNHNLERKFKTGYDCDTFAEYLSEFCARSYFEDKFIFSWNEIDRIYQGLSLNKNAKTKHPTKDFVDDLSDNLCLMYKTNDGYDFYHRSFQEYFCALYFSNDKTDAQLSSFARLYSDIRSNKKGDQTFGMLYDMIPGRIEASILLPFLKELLGAGTVTDYYSFLSMEYPELYFETGETPSIASYVINAPCSFLYAFIASHYGFSHSDSNLEDYGLGKGLPLEETYTVEKYLRQPSDDEFEDYDMVSYSELGLDINQPHLNSSGVEIYPDGSSVTYPLNEIFSLNQSDSTYKTIGGFLSDKDCPLMQEYEAAMRCCNEMEQRINRTKLVEGLFD